ncbi:hypothetical protein V8D89_014354 [Ganoderma adspersum]
MSPRRGRNPLPRGQVNHARDTPIVVARPSSLTECLPTNITWTGDTAPYSILVLLADTRDVFDEFLVVNATSLTWTPNVPVDTFVSLQVADAQNVFSAATDPVLVGEIPPPASCPGFRPAASVTASGSGSATGIASGSAGRTASGSASGPAGTVSTLSSLSPVFPSLRHPVPTHPASNTVHLTPSTYASGSSTTFPSHIPSSAPSASGVSQAPAVSLSTIAAVVMKVVMFLLWTFPWWRSWPLRRRRDNRNETDSEKQDTVEGGIGDERMSELSADADPGGGQFGRGQPDDPATPLSNPFENPENVVYLEPISTVFPISELSDQDPPQSPPGFISSPRGSLSAATRNTIFSARPRALSIVARERTSYVSVAHSDTTTARLSVTTSSESTLPPSYRSNWSTAYINDIPMPGERYPPFPPPVYAAPPPPPPLPPLPPSAFRMPVPESVKAGRPRRSLRSSLAGSQRGYQSLDDPGDIDSADLDAGRGRVESGTGTVRAAERV